MDTLGLYPFKIRADAENLIAQAKSTKQPPLELIEFLLHLKCSAHQSFSSLWGIGVGYLLESCGILCNEAIIRKLSVALQFQNAEKWIECWNDYKQRSTSKIDCSTSNGGKNVEIFKSFMRRKVDALTQLNTAAINCHPLVTPANNS